MISRKADGFNIYMLTRSELGVLGAHEEQGGRESFDEWSHMTGLLAASHTCPPSPSLPPINKEADAHSKRCLPARTVPSPSRVQSSRVDDAAMVGVTHPFSP